MSASDAELSLLTQMQWAKVPTPEGEYRFDAERRWRFDFAWVDLRVAVEVEGGSYVAGRHTRGASFERDIEKYNEAVLQGWLLLRVTPHMVEDGRALALVERALASQGNARDLGHAFVEHMARVT